MTLFNTNLWPFSSYNMYNTTSVFEEGIIKFQLSYLNGPTKTVSPWKVIPMEFYRSHDFARAIYGEGSKKTEGKKDKLSKMIIEYTNQNSWWHPTQKLSSASQGLANPVVGLKVIDTKNVLVHKENKETVIYRYSAKQNE